MNYRHAFHAGNFADVLKHAVLVRILVHLRTKPAAFRVIDTHAGAGLYNLTGPEASRSPEWQGGIGRLMAAPLSTAARGLLQPYLDAVASHNPGGQMRCYPGSPAIVQALMRSQDRLLACEMEPGAAAELARQLAADRRSKAVSIDGWTALNAFIPPKERRGLVLIDPPLRTPASLHGSHRRLKPPIANGPVASIWPGTRSRTVASRTRWAGASSAPGSARFCASNSALRRPATPAGSPPAA